MQGWIKLHRKITENKLWEDKPFSRGQAWIDMLLMANHDDNTFLFNGRFIEVEKGSFITSEVKLMERWGWSKAKTRLFLEILTEQQMLVKKTDNKKTTITICKYGDYQICETAEELQKDFKKTSEKLQKDTNKNDKECIKNDKKDIYSDLPIELHEPLREYISMRKSIKKAMTDKAIQLLIGKLNKLAPGNLGLQIAMLEEATMKNWLSVYLPKPEQSANPFKDKLKEAIENERRLNDATREGGNSNYVGYKGGLSKLLQEPK